MAKLRYHQNPRNGGQDSPPPIPSGDALVTEAADPLTNEATDPFITE